jgi:hypothetical protein
MTQRKEIIGSTGCLVAIGERNVFSLMGLLTLWDLSLDLLVATQESFWECGRKILSQTSQNNTYGQYPLLDTKIIVLKFEEINNISMVSECLPQVIYQLQRRKMLTL